MFSFDLQPDGTYIIHLIDGGHLRIKTEDTYHLRCELAKLSLRIEAREFLVNHQDYIPHWYYDPTTLTPSQITKLHNIYSLIYPYQQQWILLDSYEDTTDHQIAQLEREVLSHKELIDSLKKELDAKNPQS